MKFKITFEDIFDNVENEEQAIDVLLDYLNDCVRYEDVTAFKIEKVKNKYPKQNFPKPDISCTLPPLDRRCYWKDNMKDKLKFYRYANDYVHFEFEAGAGDNPQELEVYIGSYFLCSVMIKDISEEAKSQLFI